MKSILLLSAALAVSAPVRAAGKPVRLEGGPKSEDVLRRFVENDPALKARLDDDAKREEAFLAESRDTDLRDAVSDVRGPDDFRSRLEELPGMKAPPAPACPTLAACASPDLALDVPDAALLPEALRRLVRPWMLLQQARGSAIELTPAKGEGDAALIVRLKGLDAAPLTLNVSPRLLGGFKVWYDQPLALAALYGRERDVAVRKPALGR